MCCFLATATLASPRASSAAWGGALPNPISGRGQGCGSKCGPGREDHVCRRSRALGVLQKGCPITHEQVCTGSFILPAGDAGRKRQGKVLWDEQSRVWTMNTAQAWHHPSLGTQPAPRDRTGQLGQEPQRRFWSRTASTKSEYTTENLVWNWETLLRSILWYLKSLKSQGVE